MEMLTTMIDYNYAEHRQLWEVVKQLDQETFVRDSGYSIGSIQREVVHMIRADRLWLSRAQGIDDPDFLPNDTADRTVIRAAWDEVETEVKRFIREDQDQFQRLVTYVDRDGNQRTRAVWELMLHIANHGTVHRAEMCAMLHMLDHTTAFDISFRRYLEDRDMTDGMD